MKYTHGTPNNLHYEWWFEEDYWIHTKISQCPHCYWDEDKQDYCIPLALVATDSEYHSGVVCVECLKEKLNKYDKE
jgi:hypothetical protein